MQYVWSDVYLKHKVKLQGAKAHLTFSPSHAPLKVNISGIIVCGHRIYQVFVLQTSYTPECVTGGQGTHFGGSEQVYQCIIVDARLKA